MNAKQLLSVIGDAQDTYIAEAIATREGVSHPKHLSLKRIVLVAAVLLLSLLLVGCTVAYVLSLQELKIAEEDGIRNFNEAGDWAGPTEVTQAVISLRGYPGSPNQLATREWYEFQQSYDQEPTSNTNESDIPDKYYYSYGCYTWEMVEKVDQITEKYSLKLLSKPATVQRWQSSVMFDALGISGVCKEENAAKINDGAGLFYPEGNFKYEFEFCLPRETEEGISPVIPATVLYTRKDYFDPDYQSVDTELFQEWTYVTEEGTEVLIAMSPWGGYFFAETEEAYLTASVHMAAAFKERDAEGWDQACMEQAAEVIDFSLQPKIPDMSGMEEKLAQAEAEYEQAKQETLEKNRQSYATYAGYVKEKYIDNRESLVGTPYIRNYYALVDVTDDGEPELLLGRDERHFNDLLTIRDGKVVAIAAWGNMNLCEGGILLKSSYFPLGGQPVDDYDNPRTYGFCRMTDGEGGKKELDRFLYLDCSIETRQWTKYNEDTGETTPIAKEDIDDFLDLYPKLDLEMKPVSDFPME